MEKGWIPARDFCQSHQIEISFIDHLQQYGLLEVTVIEHETYLLPGELEKAERIIRLYADLGINLEGIDAISHLLGRIEQMQGEITALRNRLSLYEAG